MLCVGLLVPLLSGCRKAEPGEPLLAAFSSQSVVGRLNATWTKDAYAVKVANRLAEPLYVRLSGFRLLAGDRVVAQAEQSAACVVNGGDEATVLLGQFHAAPDADGFEVDRFAVPLSERGRAFYREFALQKRPGDAAAIDTEIASFAAARPCSRAVPSS